MTIRRRLRSKRSAIALGVFAFALNMTALVLLASADQTAPQLVRTTALVPTMAIGMLVAVRRPGNPLGWLLQLKWLYSGAAVFIVCLGLGLFQSDNATGVARVVGAVLAAGVAALPVALGIGILKFRLYDIDRIISRTLAYAVVTGLLIGVYAGLVLLATEVLRLHSTVAVTAATLVAAALFNPLRQRVQRAVDRRFNRAHYDAEATLAAFAGRLRESVDLTSIQNELAAAVDHAFEPTHISVWLAGSAR